MKQFRHLFITLCVCMLGSCTTYKATVKSEQKWNYGLMKVEPSWTSLSNMQERPFSLADSEKWVSKFNKENKLHYVLVKKDLDHTLLLAPNATITTVRAELRNLMQELQKEQPNLSVDDLEKWKGKVERDYSFMPAEDLNPPKNALAANEQKIYNARLIKAIGELSSLTNGYASLEKLRLFEKENPMVFNRADAPTRQYAKETIARKFNEVLAHCLKDETAALNIASEVEMVNRLYDDFTKRYAVYGTHASIQDFYKQLSAKKINILKTTLTAITKEIDNTATIAQLNDLEDKYFSNLNTTDDTIGLLEEKIKKRKQEVLYLAERERAIEQRIEHLAGTERNEELLEKAAQGDTKSMIKIAERLNKGIYVNQNLKEAAGWYKKAAESGDAEAMFHLAAKYFMGEGVPEDKRVAAEWLKKAAEKDYSEAMHALAYMYDRGEGISVDKQAAFYWYKQAAERGIVEAMYNVAKMFYDGIGVKESKSEAFKWYKMAAEKNHPVAMQYLASMYQHGEYVKMDIGLANIWFGKSAELGNSGSQQVLSIKLLDTKKASLIKLPLKENGSEIVHHKLTLFHRPIKSYDMYYDAIIIKPQKSGYLYWSFSEELVGSWYIYESESENFKSSFFKTFRTSESNKNLITQKTEYPLAANKEYLIWFQRADVPSGGIPAEFSLNLIPSNLEQKSLKDFFEK